MSNQLNLNEASSLPQLPFLELCETASEYLANANAAGLLAISSIAAARYETLVEQSSAQAITPNRVRAQAMHYKWGSLSFAAFLGYNHLSQSHE